MEIPIARALGERVFRAGSGYRLVVFDRLDPGEREALSDLRRDPDLYGVLRPAEQGATYKAVGRDTALLLFTLREAGRLPADVLEGDGAARRLQEIAELVLDGVLEVRDGDRFVSGAEALELLPPPAEPGGVEGALARLSRRALRYAAALELDEVETLAARLYAFHRLPLTPRRRRELGDAGAIADRLGFGPGGPRRRRLASWQAVERRDPGDWLGWTRRDRRTSASGAGPAFKLYVSPAVEALEQVFDVLLDVLPACRASSFKLGGDAAGLLRPDKLVAYFDDFESLSLAAGELAGKLAAVPAHGVPFTAEIAGEGLLSWGLDPPAGEAVPWRGQESWRLWVVRRLAAALAAARRQSGNAEPWRFALERLRLAGVDVERWVPRPTLWQEEL